MADPADIANDYAQGDLDRRIEAARGVINRDATVEDSADNCSECGNQIPSERQIAVPGCSLCVYCADKLEKRV